LQRVIGEIDKILNFFFVEQQLYLAKSATELIKRK